MERRIGKPGDAPVVEPACVLDQVQVARRYIERLGKGSSGTVFKALDTFNGNEVALKVLDASLFQGEGINDAEFDLGEKVWDVHIKHVLPDDAFTDKWAPAMVDEFADKFAVVAPNLIEPIDGLVELSDPVDLDYSASSDALWADLLPGVQPLDSSDVAEPDDGAGFADV
mgnify:CR=1 FL=1